MSKGMIIMMMIAATMTATAAEAPRVRESTRHYDAPRRAKRPPSIPNMPEAAQAPSNEDVGDGDSFGRSVNFLGYAQTYGVSVQADCTGWEPGTCLASDGSQQVSIEKYGDEAVIRLPARAARSLLCITATPFGFATFFNTTTTRQNASAVMLGRWRIESEVLNDPALINTGTGLPFNGVIQGGPFLGDESFSIEPGAYRNVGFTHSRTCNRGSLQRAQLVEMGLTPAQAREVFRKPITIRFGAYLSSSWATASVSPGYRVYGD